MNRTACIVAATAAAMALASCDSSTGSGTSSQAQPPNILFVIMDDVGIDQMKSFGYGGVIGPDLPNIDTVATAGLRFQNTWSMPECSPGRAAFFLGQYPTRTDINQAIGPNDLANSQVSPFATTAPKLLKQANYESGMFGKFHLAGPENNQAENNTPRELGWDYFYGWIGGLPGSVDTTAGGVAGINTYDCGFVPGGTSHAQAANHGACYKADDSCSVLSRDRDSDDPPGLRCIDSGGIFVPNQTSCSVPKPAGLDFLKQNAYYVSPLVIIDGEQTEIVPLSDPRARGYRTSIETDAAIRWINSRPGTRPWMATVSYSAAHTPWQQPPSRLLPGRSGQVFDHLSCTGTASGRIIQDKMTEAMDTEFGRLLVETGMAARGADGSLVYDPKASNTVIVIVGDNGSLGTAVKQPFVASQAKGTAYQTGVWVPLIIAGPQVEQGNRKVEHMVNTVDLYQFFAELAGIDAHQAVAQTIDSVGIKNYLTNPGQTGQRTINFTLGGVNYQANGRRNGPCVIPGTTTSSCTQIPTTKGVCGDNGGVWWGPDFNPADVVPEGADPAKQAEGYSMCWQVNEARYSATKPLYSILPETSMAIRNDTYKLLRNIVKDYDPAAATQPKLTTTHELFAINQNEGTPLLDSASNTDLFNSADPQMQAVQQDLMTKLDRMLASSPYCAGDGNGDGVVDATDVANWTKIANSWGLSSVYDFFVNDLLDGKTNTVDGDIIQANLGRACEPSYGIY